MRIVSWNVNGLRACVRKGFLNFLHSSDADVIGLQEVRAFEHQLDEATRAPDGWHTSFAPAERPGYSGVAIYSRRPPDRVETALGEPRFDAEGRLIIARFGRLSVALGVLPQGQPGATATTAACPTSSISTRRCSTASRRSGAGPGTGGGRLQHGSRSHRPGAAEIEQEDQRFLPEERAELSRWLDAGWVDTFRARHRDEPGHYTWWRQWGGMREKNVGWRIDYVLASPGAAKRVEDALSGPSDGLGPLPGRRRLFGRRIERGSECNSAHPGCALSASTQQPESCTQWAAIQ